MIGIILAAGRGKRISKAIFEKPKWSIEIKKKMLIEHQITNLENNKIKKIIIIGGYKSNLIPKRYKIIKNFKWNKTNSIFSLMQAKKYLFKNDAIITYSDIFYSSKIIRKLKKENKKICLPFNTNWKKYWTKRFKNPLDDAESFRIRKNGKIIEIGKKAKKAINIQGQFMGIMKLSPLGFKKLYKIYSNLKITEQMKIDTTSILQKCIENGINIYGFPTNELWYEIDNKKDLKIFLKQIN
tara:strand:+ start:333 stop:1052 length:720 start_codon:yes stop_codon:yes gene_type:complete